MAATDAGLGDTMNAFDYVHVPNCNCSDSIAYEERLLLARTWLLHGDPPDPCAAEIAAEYIPTGSCPDWYGVPDAGHPRDRRDHHLLARWREAIAVRGTGAAAWAKVEDARRRRSADPDTAPHVDWYPAEREAWDRGASAAEERAWIAGEDERLIAAYRAASLVELDVNAALLAALASAPWGTQPDGSFVTQRSCAAWNHTHGYVYTLHAPGKGGPLVEALCHRRGDAGRITELRTAQEARKIREAERRLARMHLAKYEAARLAAGRRLRKGLPLEYRAGQEWGTVTLPVHVRDVGGSIVSARGALRAAGLGRTEVEALLGQHADAWAERGEICIEVAS